MKELMIEIEYLLDNTNLLCLQIAEKLQCDVDIVAQIVHQRFLARVGKYL